ncbi:MAG: ABC transporter ATP-binding protein [Actinomycetota bacterium]|nr:ABC transporter ATP-binding protein [Actinomycetota bacterium]
MDAKAAADSAIELDGLGRRYGERDVLTGVTLSVPMGSTLAVFGSNGAGKTTLLRILATLLRPHAGRVRVLGSELPKESWALRGRVGLLAHEPMLYRELTARENLLFHARLHGVGEERVSALLERVGLGRRAEEAVATLSRGMTQRVAICRVALPEPELLLLDEPLANLDPGASAAIEPLIGRETGSTRVVVSHDIDQGLSEADHVLGLRDGKAAVLAPAAEVTRAQIAELYR